MPNNSSSARQLLGRILSTFAERGWRDNVGAALAITEAAVAPSVDSPARSIAAAIPRDFLVQNKVTRESASAAIVAELEGWKPAPPALVPRPTHPTTLLFVSASPDDQTPLKVDREMRLVRDELEKTPLGRSVIVDPRPATLVDEFARYLLEAIPTIIHFSGHGDVDGVCMEDANGTTAVVAGSSLKLAFEQEAVAQHLRVVVLNSCLSTEQAGEIVEAVDYVVGMSASVPDDVALAFTRGLYMALAQGLDIAQAFEFGRVSISLSGLPEDWMPILFARPGRQGCVIGDG